MLIHLLRIRNYTHFLLCRNDNKLPLVQQYLCVQFLLGKGVGVFTVKEHSSAGLDTIS